MKYWSILLALFFLTTGACDNDYTPKPRGYFRIDLPQHGYRKFDTVFPFTFEYPVYATLMPDNSKMAEPYWINIRYNPFHATLHLSYKFVRGNLSQYLEDSRTLVNKHIQKASAITQREFTNPDQRVFGLVYDIRGSDAASSYQFYVTDSLSEFVRGALYFNLVPNNDSLAPVIDFLKEDIDHLIGTFKWKKAAYD